MAVRTERVWVPTHVRNGRTVHGHWRDQTVLATAGQPDVVVDSAPAAAVDPFASLDEPRAEPGAAASSADDAQVADRLMADAYFASFLTRAQAARAATVVRERTATRTGSGLLTRDESEAVADALLHDPVVGPALSNPDAAIDVARESHELVAAARAPAFACHADLADWLNDDQDEPDANYRWHGLDGRWTDGYEIAFAFDQPVHDPAHLVAYYMRGQVAMGSDGFDGDRAGTAVGPVDAQGRARVWRYGCDLTKSARDDVGMAIEGLPAHVAEGSPVRKTDRSGPGTRGTRAVDGTGQAPTIAIR